ncbi:MAG: sugar transferase [Balneolaceae bacterium]
MRRFLDLLFGSFLYVLYLLLNPFIFAYLKLSGVDSPYRYFNGIGQFGNILRVKIYNIGYYQSVDDDAFSKTTSPNHFLYKTNLFKLPLVIRVLKGNMSLVGPQILNDKFALELIDKYTDFHKRFAPKPGVFSPSCYYRFENRQDDYSNELRDDLNYASRQTLKSYLNTL